MKQEINPKDTSRAAAFELWMSSPMPMVTLVKTMDVSRLVKACKRKSMSFNMALCWCIGKAATEMQEFYTIPEKGKLYTYDMLAINVIVNNAKGGINSCDIPYTENITEFSGTYQQLTRQVAETCKSSFIEDRMIIGTSAMIQTELDCIVNQYTDKFCNPMVMWGKYRKGWFKTTLPISFQFHHVQMDGGHGALFLEKLQQTINSIG
ncbi:MAG: CatA-like O-acetyltransferase, family 2 [Bacteroidales bacterium]|nr:CatA-like O-acetyltransferase, family 2 [Bacteroidales bacterium]